MLVVSGFGLEAWGSDSGFGLEAWPRLQLKGGLNLYRSDVGFGASASGLGFRASAYVE